MVEEMEKFKEEDDKMEGLSVDAKDQLESYTYQLKTAQDEKNALEEEDRTKLKEKMK